MKVVTEQMLRSEFKTNMPEKYMLQKEVLLTPSARQYLNDNRIKIVTAVEELQERAKPLDNLKTTDARKSSNYKYVCSYTGGYFDRKPEYMTQLYGEKLVYKNHPRIILRGKLDSLQSNVLELQVSVEKIKNDKLQKDLCQLLQFIREILKAEVLEEELKEIMLFNLKEDELREMSHHPEKHFNLQHVLPHYEMGEIVIGLNALRSHAREVEICGLDAFKKEEKIERQDILKALNRLSSGIYILMCRYLGGFYS